MKEGGHNKGELKHKRARGGEKKGDGGTGRKENEGLKEGRKRRVRRGKGKIKFYVYFHVYFPCERSAQGSAAAKFEALTPLK